MNFSEKNQIIILYSFTPTTKEFCGSFEYFWAIGTGLAVNSTQVKPLDAKDGFTIVFDESEQNWSYIEDHRKTKVYAIDTQQESEIDYLGRIKDGYTILKPANLYDTWNGTAWVDLRTDAEKRAAYLASFPVLTKRKFNLYLFDNGFKDEVDALLAANPRTKVEFDSTDEVKRNSPTVEAMIALLGWTDEQVNQMWQQALML